MTESNNNVFEDAIIDDNALDLAVQVGKLLVDAGDTTLLARAEIVLDLDRMVEVCRTFRLGLQALIAIDANSKAPKVVEFVSRASLAKYELLNRLSGCAQHVTCEETRDKLMRLV